MKLDVKGLRAKKTAGGIRYYWEPSPLERRAKWTGLKLGMDAVAAVAAADKRNREIEEWKAGGAKPREVARHVRRQTVGHGIQRYRDEKLAKQAPNTIRTMGTALTRLDTWAGDQPIGYVTRERVRKLRAQVTRPVEEGGLSPSAAFHLFEAGRAVWRWFIDEADLAETNPFERFGVSKPAPRQAFWEDRHVAAIVAAAEAEAQPMVALAVEIGLYCGQREADNLKMLLTSWREIPKSKFRADPAIWDTLVADASGPNAGPDAGKVMGLYVRQGKTKRWVGIPIEGDTRRRIEAAIEQARGEPRSSSEAVARQPRLTILGDDDRGGAPWKQDDFIKRFGRVRQRAASDARAAGDDTLADELEALWYGDLRRSCVVYLGELGLDDAAIAAITGHSLQTVKTILETYMPRTEGMAARAIIARREARGEQAERQQKEESR